MDLKEIYEKINPVLKRKGIKATIGPYLARDEVIQWQGTSNGIKGIYQIFILGIKGEYTYSFDFVGNYCGWGRPAKTVEKLLQYVEEELGTKLEKVEIHEQMRLF